MSWTVKEVCRLHLQARLAMRHRSFTISQTPPGNHRGAENHQDRPVWERGILEAERFSSAQLDRSADSDRNFQKELLAVFAVELNRFREEMQNQQTSPDRLRLRHLGHGMTPAARYVGAMRLSRMAEALEKEATDGSAESVAEMLPALVGETESLLEMLKSSDFAQSA